MPGEWRNYRNAISEPAHPAAAGIADPYQCFAGLPALILIRVWVDRHSLPRCGDPDKVSSLFVSGDCSISNAGTPLRPKAVSTACSG
jgi:hypothetical protein